MTMTVAVVGPGSVGVFFAGHLAAAGHDVVACARRPFDRYVIESDEFPLDIEAHVETAPTAISETVDWVLLSVKAHQTEGAAGWLNALCGPETKVMVVQNGIEHDRAQPFINSARLIPTVVYCGAELTAPGQIAHFASGHLFAPEEPFGDDMRALFADSQAEVRPTAKFVTHQWRKLGMNIMANGLTALTGRTMSVLGDPSIKPIAIELLRECWTLAKADGADLDAGDAEQLVESLIGMGRDGGTSMLYDTRAGRPTEHDAIHGAALRRGQARGIATPTISVIHGLLEARSA